MDHVLFIPWTRTSGLADEQLIKCETWRSSADNYELNRQHYYSVVCAGDGYDFGQLSHGSEIYVRGHGGIGDHEIVNDEYGTSALSYKEVARLLIAQGLRKTWFGRIKFYNCNSGTCKLGSQSFAAKAAQYMRFKKGYHLITYVGYLGALDSYPVDEGGKKMHKYVTRFSRSPFKSGPFERNKEVKSKWSKVFF